MYSLLSFLLPFFMASSTTLSLKSVRVAHPLRHLRFLACMRHRVRIPTVHLRMHCTTVRDHAHRGEVSLSVRLVLRKIRNILSIRRTLDISSKNRCCNRNCDLYSGKYGRSIALHFMTTINRSISSSSLVLMQTTPSFSMLYVEKREDPLAVCEITH